MLVSAHFGGGEEERNLSKKPSGLKHFIFAGAV
jgi:hypothetical protein